jgi:hypothetical protein
MKPREAAVQKSDNARLLKPANRVPEMAAEEPFDAVCHDESDSVRRIRRLPLWA